MAKPVVVVIMEWPWTREQRDPARFWGGGSEKKRIELQILVCLSPVIAGLLVNRSYHPNEESFQRQQSLRPFGFGQWSTT